MVDTTVISDDLAAYIEKHDEALEDSRKEFEWTDTSFYSHNGDIELQHDTFHGENHAEEKKFCWDISVPPTPPHNVNATFSSAKEAIISDDESSDEDSIFLSPHDLTKKTMPLKGTPHPIGAGRHGGE